MTAARFVDGNLHVFHIRILQPSEEFAMVRTAMTSFPPAATLREVFSSVWKAARAACGFGAATAPAPSSAERAVLSAEGVPLSPVRVGAVQLLAGCFQSSVEFPVMKTVLRALFGEDLPSVPRHYGNYPSVADPQVTPREYEGLADEGVRHVLMMFNCTRLGGVEALGLERSGAVVGHYLLTANMHYNGMREEPLKRSAKVQGTIMVPGGLYRFTLKASNIDFLSIRKKEVFWTPHGGTRQKIDFIPLEMIADHGFGYGGD
jgi:hypothetical protein